MSKSSRQSSTKKTKRKTIPATQDGVSTAVTSSIYVDYVIWTDRKRKPKWHPVRKMRYVFFRMMDGITITDALKEIKWSPSEFWHLIDLRQPEDPFSKEYLRTKKLQGRAIADSVMTIAEGRDPATKLSLRKIRKMMKTALRRAGKQKSKIAMTAIIERLLSNMNENEHRIVARNKLQMDGAKWLAKSVNPQEFADQSRVALGGVLPPRDGDEDPTPIRIQFVAPDGSVVEP